jgi:hypothetical protein
MTRRLEPSRQGLKELFEGAPELVKVDSRMRKQLLRIIDGSSRPSG